MTMEQVQLVAGKLAASTNTVIIPGLMLLAMVGMFIWVLYKSQRREDFDASEFLRGENGHLSAARLFAFVCLSVHTWVVATQTLNEKLTEYNLLIYAVTWSGSLVLLEALRVWNGGRPPAPDPPA